jgi:single-strand DNA-binding protein
MNLNKVLLIGRLTRDPELRTTSGGQSVASFGLATNRNWTDKAGQKQEEVEFHNIVVWGRQAELASQFLKKGQLAHLEGRMQTRSWQGQDGQSRKTTEVVAERVQFGPRAMSSMDGPVGPPGAPSPAKRESPPPVLKRDLSASIPEINIDEDEIKPEEVPF